MKHRYVLVRIRDGYNLSEQQGMAVRLAVESLSAAWDGGQPSALFQARLSRDGRQAIYEITYAEQVTTALAVAAVSQVLGLKVEQITAMTEFFIFAENDSYEKSRAACQEYLAEHAADWEEGKE